MIKTKLTLLFLAICVLNGFSQDLFTEKPGKVTGNEMNMTEYDKDPEAEALVIYQLGEYKFIEGHEHELLLEMKIRKKIKILKQAGIDYANFEIPYYVESRDSEIIRNIEGITYNLVDGQLVETKLETKKIFEEKIDENRRLKKIALADVREGSVIELSYTIITPYFRYMRNWDFQQKIPVLHSKLTYAAIPYYEYSYIVKGVTKLDEFESKVAKTESHYGPYTFKEVVYSFGLYDIPAFRDEEFISSSKDYIASIHFQMAKINYPKGGVKHLISTWPQISESLLNDDQFGKYIKSSEKEANKILPSLSLENKNPNEKLSIITNYVKDNYKWNDYYGKYADLKLSDFLKQKAGNAANLNLFLIGLLQKAGLNAYPIALSTRDNGAIRQDQPFLQFFNYVIAGVEIDDRIYFVDATEPLLHNTSLPTRCINVLWLIIKPKLKEEEWIITQQQSKMLTDKNFLIDIDPEKQVANVKSMFVSNGNTAFNLRKEYAGTEENLVKYYKKNNNIAISNVKVSNYEKTHMPLVIGFDFNTGIESNNNKLFVHPFCNIVLSTNLFKQISRSLPIDLIYLIGESYKSSIKIPEGYRIEHLPEEIKLDNDIMSFTYTVTQNNNVIEIAASYSIKQNIYDAEQYNELKLSFAKMIDQLAEIVVLAK